MDVLVLSPQYPMWSQRLTRALVAAGARVWGVGDVPASALPAPLQQHLSGWLHVPRILDEHDVRVRVRAWLGGRRPDRIEGSWEPVAMLAARLREDLGVHGMLPDVVAGFRDKPLMRARVRAAGVPAPGGVRVRTVGELERAARQAGFPLIVKPPDGAGSANTWRARDWDDLRALLPALRPLPEVTVEPWVEGPEHTVEALHLGGEPVWASVCQYLPNTLVARKEAWISPAIVCRADLDAPHLQAGIQLAHAATRALGMGSGVTHLEWFHTERGPVFGEVACRMPGANMLELTEAAWQIDLAAAWAATVLDRRPALPERPRRHAAIVFKRAQGPGPIRAHIGLEAFVRAHREAIVSLDLLPVGAARRDWTQTFLSDGWVILADPDLDRLLERVSAFQRDVTVVG